MLKLNLEDYIGNSSLIGKRQVKVLEKCSDKEATIEFSLKSTLVSSNVAGQETLSQMSDVMSMDSGPDSEYDMNDFENN